MIWRTASDISASLRSWPIRKRKGCRVNVVGEGTPAAAAGIEVGDVILDFKGEKTPTPSDVFDVLKTTEPSQVVPITVLRGGAAKKLSVTLGRRPLEVIRPEFDTDPIEQSVGGNHDPLSFLTTLHDIDDDEIPADADHVNGEIHGRASARRDNWEGKKIGNDTVEFVKKLPKWNLEIVKRYRLAQIPDDQIGDADPYAYHLMLHVEIRNLDKKATFRRLSARRGDRLAVGRLVVRQPDHARLGCSGAARHGLEISGQ